MKHDLLELGPICDWGIVSVEEIQQTCRVNGHDTNRSRVCCGHQQQQVDDIPEQPIEPKAESQANFNFFFFFSFLKRNNENKT